MCGAAAPVLNLCGAAAPVLNLNLNLALNLNLNLNLNPVLVQRSLTSMSRRVSHWAGSGTEAGSVR